LIKALPFDFLDIQAFQVLHKRRSSQGQQMQIQALLLIGTLKLFLILFSFFRNYKKIIKIKFSNPKIFFQILSFF